MFMFNKTAIPLQISIKTVVCVMLQDHDNAQALPSLQTFALCFVLKK